MQKNWLTFIYKISLFFFAINIWTANNSGLQVSQVSDLVQNIQMVTQGQEGQEQIGSLKDLEQIFGLTMNVLTINMNDYTTQELASIAFGGYTFIDNPFDKSAGVSLNILKELLPLNFQEMAQNGTNSIYIGLFAKDASGKLLTNLYQAAQQMNTINALDHFNLYIFNSNGTLLGNPLYVPLNKYYSFTQKNFIIPNFAGTSSQANDTVSNFDFFINGQNALEQSEISYPYLVNIQNISGINVPNRYLNYAEINAVLPNLNNPNHQISSSYQTIGSLEIIIGNKAFSFNQNSINQSTEIAKNGICADISKYTASLENSGMSFIFAAVDVDGNIITDQSKIQTQLSHYLLFILDTQKNLVKGIYVNPEYSTDASYFKIEQDPDAVTVRINGNSITQGQQYSYPVMINLTYGSGVTLPALSSITNKITLKGSEILSSLVYNLASSSGTAALDFASSTLFDSNWLDSINEWLDVGQTLLINTEQSYYSTGGVNSASGSELILTVYSATDKSQIAQQIFGLPAELSGLSISYQVGSSNIKKSSQAAQILTVNSTHLNNSWIAIIPSNKNVPSKTLTSSSLKKFAANYGNLKAFLNLNKILLYSTPVNSFAQANTMPGWYNKVSKAFSYQGFDLQLDQMKSGEGYFFVQDTETMDSSKFSGTSGVAGLLSGSKLLQELEKTIAPQGTCAMVLLAFDTQGNFIPDIIKTAPDYFNLYIFDENGNKLSSSPMSFKASDYVGLGNYALRASAQSPATFILTGLGVKQVKSLTYPFAAKISWNVAGKIPKHKKTPKKIPTKPSVSYTILSTLSLSELQNKIVAIKTNAKILSAQDGDFDVQGWWYSDPSNYNAHRGSGFNFTLNQMSSGKGYAFIQDPWNNYIQKPFANKQGIAGLAYGSAAYLSLLANMNSGPNPELTLVVLGFDKDNNYIDDIIATAPTSFYLFAYDTSGNLLPGYPFRFDPSNYVGAGGYNLQKDAKGPAQFVFNGIGAVGNLPTLTYPFALTIQWIENGVGSANIWKASLGDAFGQLWIDVDYSGFMYAEIGLIAYSGAALNTLGTAIVNNFGKRNVILKATIASDTNNHYALMKAYAKDTTTAPYRSLTNAVIYSWPLHTSVNSLGLHNLPKGAFLSTIPYLASSPNNELPINLETAAINAASSTQHYKTDSNGQLLVNFTI